MCANRRNVEVGSLENQPTPRFGQKTKLLSHHHQGFRITTRGLPRLCYSKMSCVEKEFILGTRKCEEYKGRRFYNGDCVLVVDVCLHRVDEDASLQSYSPPVSTSEK